MLNCGLGVILGRERCPPDLEGSSSVYLLSASISISPLLIFFLLPHPITSWGREGRGKLSFLLAQRAAPPTGHAGGDGRGRSWRQAGGAAWRGPRQRKGGPLVTEARRQPDLPYYWTPGSCLFRPSVPATESPSMEYDLLDPLGGDAAAWTVKRGTVPSQGHLGPLLSPSGQ